MTKALITLIALCLAATAGAQEAKVTPLVTLDLAGTDGKEGTMVVVEYAPAGSTLNTATMLMPSSMCWKGRS